MKRLLSIILVISMIFGSASFVNVFASEEQLISIIAKDAEYKEGRPCAYASAELSANPGISNLTLVVYYKADELKLSQNTDKAFENSVFSAEQSSVSSEISGSARAIKQYLPEGAVATEYKGFTVDLCGEWDSAAENYTNVTAKGNLFVIPFEAVSFTVGAEYKYTVVVASAENASFEGYSVEGLTFEGVIGCALDNELGKYSDFTLFLSPEEQRIENRKEDTFKVDLRIDGNPGLWNMHCYLVYPKQLVLKNIENGYIFPDDTFSTLYENRPLSDSDQLDTFQSVINSQKLPQKGHVSTALNFKYSGVAETAEGNGVCAILEFEMPKNASYEELLNISVYYANGDIYGPPSSLGFENFYPETVGASVVMGCDHSEIVSGYKEPTCGSDGYNGTVCAFCNELYSGEILPATEDHTLDEPNCIEGQYCIKCNKLVIPPTGAHTPNPWEGCMRPSICSACGIVIEEAPGHVKDKNDVCKVCGGFSTKHPYTSNAYAVDIYRSGAESVTITFSKESYTDYSDRVYVYDMGGTYVAGYSLGDMASKTLTVHGEGVRISFSPRYSGKYYGFDIENVTWEYPEFCGDYGYRETDSGEEIEIVSYIGSGGVVSIPSEINGKPVTKIGCNAFAGKTEITGIEIPETVTAIDTGAFSGCSSLTGVYVPGNVKMIGDRAFGNCSSLISANIADGVTSIGDWAFSEAKVILFPKTLETLGSCDEPEYILFSGTKDEWKFDNVFVEYDEFGYEIYPEVYCNCVYADDGIVYQLYSETASALCYLGDEAEVHIASQISGRNVKSIGLSNFSMKDNIEKIHIPASIRTIVKNAFSGCTALSGVYIEDMAAWCTISLYDSTSNPLTVAKKLYLNGKLVTHLVIPAGVTTVNNTVFINCSSILKVTVPGSLSYIGEYAFSGCTWINTVYYAHTDEQWAKISVRYGNTCITNATKVYNYGTPLAGFDFTVNYSDYTITITGYESDKTEMVIPQLYETYIVRYIAPGAFEGNSKITSVVIPSTVLVIPENAFKDCNNLEKVKIKEGVRDIGDYAFSGCTSLTEIVIPESVEYIFAYAFNECTSLKHVALPYSLMAIEYKAFYMCDAIERVTYNGSEERWNNLDIASGNASLERAGIVFNDTPDTGDNEVRFSAVGELSEGGDTVTVKVYVDENPGTWCMRFNVNYNSEYFTLISAGNGEVYLDSETAGRNLGGYYSYYAENTDVYDNNSKTGLILTLTFAVAEGVPDGEYSFNVDFPDDVESWFFDAKTLSGRTVSCTSQAVVAVESEEASIPGDLNGDGEVNAKDSNLFKRAISGELSIAVGSPEFATADLDGDGELNAKDANLLKRVIAGEIQI